MMGVCESGSTTGPQRVVDELGAAISEGRDAVAYLWQVPTDDEVRGQVATLLQTIATRSRAQGRREMPQICREMLVAAKASPSPQQVDILVNGFDRLYKLWGSAKSGLMSAL